MDVAKLLLLLLPLFFTITIQSSPKPSLSPPHFINSVRQSSSNETIEIPPQQYFEVTLPLPTDDSTPACSVNVLSGSYGNTSGSGSGGYENFGNTSCSFENFGNTSCGLRSTSCTFESTSCSFGNFGNTSCTFGNFGNTSCTFGNTSCSFENTSCTFGNSSGSFGNSSGSFGKTSCSFANTSCSFGDTSGSPANISGSPLLSVNYTPPPVTCEWSRAVLEYQAECKAEQYESIAGVWIDGVELLRTSTAQPTEDGVIWTVRKDVTRYTSIITQENLTLSVMLENLGNDEFTGVYQVNVSFLFYSDKPVRFPLPVVSGESEDLMLNRKLISVKTHESEDTLELDRVIKSLYPYDTPADLIIPISGAVDGGYWFRIQNEYDVRKTNVQISKKTYKAVLELYVSFHGDDEFWYMNPPDSYIQANQLPTGKANGAYREVLVTIDGKLVGTVIPFPVIFSGGINPLFWQPVVSIGAFDLPSYDIDFTPFLGLLLDYNNHSIGFQVADGMSFWLVDANLHLWLDHSNVQAIVEYEEPSMEIENEYEFEGLEGEFEIEVERSSKAIGWVQSSAGILKTKVKQEIKFNNKLKFKDGGTRKELDQKIKTKTKIKITNAKDDKVAKIEIENNYPLQITIETKPVFGKDTSLMTTTVVQGRSEKYTDDVPEISRDLNHDQNCTGSMLVKGNSVISGSTENHQNYDYKNEFGCYSRKVDVVDGHVVADETLLLCVD